MDKPTRICSANGCDRPAKNGRVCWSHYKRRDRPRKRPTEHLCLRCGSPFSTMGVKGMPSAYCSQQCRKSHNPRRKPRETFEQCSICGKPNSPEIRFNRYCSDACKTYASRHGSPRPGFRECCECGDIMNMRDRDVNGTLVYRRNEQRCIWCKARSRPHRYGMTAADVAERDGYECRWCGDAVDFSLVGSRSKWAPSIDHIVPWSRGGTNDPENLQLMHRVCNAIKGVAT